MATQPQQQPHKKRKIIQIAADTVGNGSLVALCDDGTVWWMSELTRTWAQVDTTVVDFAPAMPEHYTPPTSTIPATAGAVGAAAPTH